MEWRLVSLGADTVKCHLGELLRLDRQVGVAPWGAAEFLLELPEKWRHSLLVSTGEGPVAFAIASRKGDSVHLHRFVVDAPARGQGVGVEILAALEVSAREAGASRLTLKVPRANAEARRFYAHRGFVTLGVEGDNDIMERELETFA